MKYKFSELGDILIATTRDIIGADEYGEMLHRLVEAFDASGANVILVDHRNSQIDITIEEAINFGNFIGDRFSARKSSFIAFLVNEQDPSLKLVDVSIMVALKAENQIFIKSYVEEQLAVKAIASWRKSNQEMINSL